MIQKLSNTILPLVLFAALLSPSFAAAGGTKIWELAGFEELDKGEIKNTSLSSEGEVSLGTQADRVDLEETGIVWSAARDKSGRIYLGTAYDGKIFRIDDGKAVEIATTEQLVITSLAFDKKGDLYASSLPDAVIWKIPSPSTIKKGKPKKAVKWARLTTDKSEAMHIWSLAFEDGGSTLFAGTGPEGKVFAVGADTKSSVYFDSEEEHILTLLSQKKGSLLAGTSPDAKLLQISGPGRTSTLADFDATEVKAVAVRGNDIYVAVNKFNRPPAVPTKPKIKLSQSSNKGPGSNSTASKIPKLGDGSLYVLKENGQLEKLWNKSKNHVVSIAAAKNGLLYAGLASGGRVVSVDKYRNIKSELDLDERQVMVLLADDKLMFAATGDTGAAYRLVDTRPSEAFYITPPLSAGATAAWGRFNWFAVGTLVVQSRSGNTLKPDKSWSDWSKPLTNGGPVASAPASYIQFRFSWRKDPKAALRSMELAYLPQNRRAVITSFDPDIRFPKTKTKSKLNNKKNNQVNASKRSVSARPSDENYASMEITWKVDNPDDDKLRFRLWYRSLGEKLWRPILKEDKILTKLKYEWDTSFVPEGRYQIKITADDSLSNDPEDTLSDEHLSVPVMVDNHQPRVTKLAFSKGRVKGTADDSFSAISGLEFSVDSGPWMPFTCKDKIFDEVSEEFDLELPVELSSGPHAIAVRTYDRTGNVGIAEIHINVK